MIAQEWSGGSALTSEESEVGGDTLCKGLQGGDDPEKEAWAG